ncbi:M20 family metallo-hydrolase [Paeniglutamicibacter gangotriensis]|uniref:M20 family metallo-hydrolase n=1 Tax=Paeniglutamicibacter gangotriensis TaxID=254787 RepID=A0A5B0E5A3_9MICC|nr:M20 family metallo-hydrolase [Paeniglutamicibacter gangotriensis]KAA0973365.1 M20 family metallo-hydrolase [Paeniglutamicibacter gangotriensis]
MQTVENTSAERLNQLFSEIENFSDPEFEGWTRTAFSSYYKEERRWMLKQFSLAGLNDVHTDLAGNIVGTLPGRDPSAEPIVLGSHTDTVERGGRFDGVVGVLGALEVARRIQESGSKLGRPLMIIDFFAEEANEFGLTCLGSRSLVNNLSQYDLDRASPDGKLLGFALQDFGVDPSGMLTPNKPHAKKWHAYLELHIEQSTALVDAECEIGVVTAIAGIKRLMAKYIGQYDHAGGARMNSRKDALLAAASSALELHDFACGSSSYAVATTTHIDSLQTAQNVVPGKAHLRAEVRSTDATWLTSVEIDLAQRLQATAREHNCEVDLDWFVDNEIIHTDPSLQETVIRATTERGLSWMSVPSGATHDAVHISYIAPMCMVFVPSIGGRSHCPEEFTPQRDILNGIAVLEGAVRIADSTSVLRV